MAKQARRAAELKEASQHKEAQDQIRQLFHLLEAHLSQPVEPGPLMEALARELEAFLVRFGPPPQDAPAPVPLLFLSSIGSQLEALHILLASLSGRLNVAKDQAPSQRPYAQIATALQHSLTAIAESELPDAPSYE